MAEKNLEFQSSGWMRSGAAPAAAPEKIVPPVENPCAVPVMAHFDLQPWEAYDAEVGVTRGTIFPALDLPFIGEGACRYE